MIKAQAIVLLEGVDRVIARGIVAIDEREGVPPVIFWEGDAYLPTLKVDGEQCYRKTRVMHAGASFEAVR